MLYCTGNSLTFIGLGIQIEKTKTKRNDLLYNHIISIRDSVRPKCNMLQTRTNKSSKVTHPHTKQRN